MGPLLYGTGINVTVFSYLDKIDFGFMVCRDVVPDPWFLAEGVPLAMEELKQAAAEAALSGRPREQYVTVMYT